jgi:hypothetical protein
MMPELMLEGKEENQKRRGIKILLKEKITPAKIQREGRCDIAVTGQ